MEGLNARDDFTLGLKVYRAAGAEIGWLPKPLSMTVAFPLSDMPSLTFEYQKDSPGASWFAGQQDGLEVAVMIWVPGAKRWIEPPNGRFLVLQWEDDVVDDKNVMRFTCPGYAWLLSKHLIMKGARDDALNAAEEAAKKVYDSASSTLKSHESNMVSRLSTILTLLKYKGGAYYQSGFPKSVTASGVKSGIPNKSILYNTSTKKLYWYSSARSSWFLVTNAKANEELPALGTYWANIVSARNALKPAESNYERAKDNAKEATKGGKRPMVKTTAGWALKRHWDESKARGGGRLKGMTRSFNGTYSTGPDGALSKLKWQTRFDIELTIGMSILDLLNQLVEMGQIEWQFRGRTLDVFRPGVYDLDLSERVGLHLGYDLTEAPDKATRHDFANYLVVRGEGNLSFGMQNTGSDSQVGWGTWEKAVTAAGATKIADAKELVTEEAKVSLKRVKVESTRGITVRPGGVRPMYDFLPGHRVRVYGSDGTMQRVRVMQVTLHAEKEGAVTGNLVLGDRFYRSAIDFRKSLSRTIGGYEKTIGGGSTPLPPQPPMGVPDSIRLASPLLTVGARVAINEATGQSGTTLSLSWVPAGVDVFEFDDDGDPGDETDPEELVPDW